MLQYKYCFFLLFSSLCVLFSACSTKPDGVLSDKKMEDVLYDLYLAEGIIDANPNVFTNDSLRKQDLLNSVFSKHKVTEEEFDFSMDWYATQLERFLRINDKVIARYDEADKKLNQNIDSLALKQAQQEEQILFKSLCFELQTPGMLQNRYIFFLSEPKLEFVKQMKVHFSVSGVSKEIAPQMNLLIYTGKEETIRHQEIIDREGNHTFTYSIPPSIPVKSIYGFIEIPDSLHSKLLFTNFLIMKDEDMKREALESVKLMIDE